MPVPTVTYNGQVATLVMHAFSSAHQHEIDLYLEAAADIFTSQQAQSTCS